MVGDFVTIAKIVKPQVRRGEVAAELHTDFPERFAERAHLFALTPKGERRELELEEFWPHKGRMVLKFCGVDSISDAEELTGCEVQIPAEQRAALDPGEYYVTDLIGCEVAANGRELGRIRDVDFGAGTAPLLVAGEGKQEILLPFAEEFIQEVDVAGKRVRLQVPDGLLEE